MTAKNLRKEGGAGCTVGRQREGHISLDKQLEFEKLQVASSGSSGQKPKSRAAKRLALVKLQTLRTSGRRICKKPGSTSQNPERRIHKKPGSSSQNPERRIRKKPGSNSQNPERRIRKKQGSNSQNPEGYDSKLNRAIRDIFKFYACEEALADALDKECKAEEEQYGRFHDPVVHTAFEERQFGKLITGDRASRIPCSVVSIALFDGDTMLFACSGIPLPCGRSKLELTRYVTSARLAEEYKNKTYRDDKLRIKVCLPNDQENGGFFELCNSHIAIVTLLGDQDGQPLDVERMAGLLSNDDEILAEDDEVLAAGCAFKSRCLMAGNVKVVKLPVEGGLRFPVEGGLRFWKPVSTNEGGPLAVLGGPLLGKDNRIIGMNIDVADDGYVSFLSLESLYLYLNHFQILNPKELHFREYSMPDDTYTIYPSGMRFMSKIYHLRHLGYPMPPPLVLEFNGELVNKFEELFGDVRAWKGYPFVSPNHCDEPVWRHLRKDVVKDIFRRVVSVASFRGYERYFACTGLLIKWHGRAVVLTSASLVRSCNDEKIYEDKIDKNLKIDVFLPPKQRASGKLELYSLKYNIAIISFKKKFISICPENIFRKYPALERSGKVVAVGSEPLDGLLMASIGEVKPRDKDFKLDCKDLQVSTCKIKKAGIGGPLINLDGSFVGMNFFDGRKLTPFLPRSRIVQVLRSKINLPLPSKSRVVDSPVHLKGVPGGNSYRWPVPEPYWYHGLLDVDRSFHKHIGRVLQ